MEDKKCIECEIEKPLKDFAFRKDTKKYRNSCKDCNKKYFKNQYIKNFDEISKKNSEKYLEDPEKVKRRVREWRKNNPEKRKEYRDKNKEKTNAKKRISYQENIYTRREMAKEYRKNNPDKLRVWRKKDKSKLNVRIQDSLRSRLRAELSGNYKNGSAVKDLGCSIVWFKQYLESKFYDNSDTGEQMTWENYGLYGWHIDHIIPLSSFDLGDREQLLKACNYTNLQPLWAKDNLRKGSKIK